MDMYCTSNKCTCTFLNIIIKQGIHVQYNKNNII